MLEFPIPGTSRLRDWYNVKFLIKRLASESVPDHSLSAAASRKNGCASMLRGRNRHKLLTMKRMMYTGLSDRVYSMTLGVQNCTKFRGTCVDARYFSGSGAAARSGQEYTLQNGVFLQRHVSIESTNSALAALIVAHKLGFLSYARRYLQFLVSRTVQTSRGSYSVKRHESWPDVSSTISAECKMVGLDTCCFLSTA